MAKKKSASPSRKITKAKKVVKAVVKKVVAKAKPVPVKVEKAQGKNYWEKRSAEDPQRDWGTDADSWISEYWGSQEHPHRVLVVEALKRIGEWTTLFEVGSGVGPNLAQIMNAFPGKDAFGCDVNKDVVAMTAGLGVNVELGSADNIPRDKQSMDVVLSDACLMYVPPADIKKVIKEMARVAKKAIILVEWFDKSELGVVKDNHWARNYPKLLGAAGFEVVENHKITGNDWDNERWLNHGHLFVAIKK